VPTRATIHKIMKRHGLVTPEPKKRPMSSYRRFAYARPRDCYQIDATEVELAGGVKVVVVEVLGQRAGHRPPRRAARPARRRGPRRHHQRQRRHPGRLGHSEPQQPLRQPGVTVLRDHDHITVYTADGHPIGHLHVDFTVSFQLLQPAA
jgi:hypothetical protein